MVRKAILVTCLLSLWAFLRLIESGLASQLARLEKSKIEVEHLDRMQYPSFPAPALDVRLEILRSNPGLPAKAIAVLENRNPKNLDNYDFHLAFDFLFLVENHGKLADLAANHRNYRVAIDHLDFVYLLPAYLYERLGRDGLASMYYRRYLRVLKRIAGQRDLVSRSSIQRRFSFVRLKLLFLDRVLLGVREEYHRASFLSALAGDFFEFNLHRRYFLGRYVDWGLIDRPDSPDLNNIEFDAWRLREKAWGTSAVEAPFIHYELCVFETLYSHGFEGGRQCRFEKILSSLPEGSPFIPLSLYLWGRSLNYLEGPSPLDKFREAELLLDQDTEFLRDDIQYEKAMYLLHKGRASEARAAFLEIVQHFDAATYDHVVAATEFLRWMDTGSWR